MWSWRVYTPLVDTCAIPDLAHLLGDKVDVEALDETHFALDAAVDLRRVHSDGSDVLMLRTRAAQHYSAMVECWVSHPKLRLRCGPGASDAVALTEARPWLLRLAQGDSLPDGAAERLRALAQGELPPAVRMSRRKLRSCLPSASGVLVEQSDLSAAGRLWRSVCFESTSPAKVRDAVTPVREHFVAAGLVQSAPLFLRMLLRTASEAEEARDDAPEPVVAPVGPMAAVPPGSLAERLLDAWYALAISLPSSLLLLSLLPLYQVRLGRRLHPARLARGAGAPALVAHL